MAIKVLIFDLDDTLLDSTDQMRWRGIESACNALRGKGFAMKVDCEEFLMHESLKNLSMKKALEKLCRNDAELVKIGFDAYHDFDVSGITLYDGVPGLLERLHKKHKLVLLTSGDTILQKRKIEELRIEGGFDLVLFDDRSTDKTKKDSLSKIAKKFGAAHEQCAVIGDRIDNELRYGKELGMKTILLKTGPYEKLKPKDEFEKPDQTIFRITNVDDAIKAL